MKTDNKDLKDLGNIAEQIGGLTGGMKDIMGSAMDNAGKLQKSGPEGAEGDRPFDETESIIVDNKRVAGIIVRSGDIIDSIQLVYDDKSQGEIHGSGFGGSPHSVKIGAEDGLAAIEGYKGISFGGGRALTGLLIRTKKGQTYGPFGNRRGGQKFLLTVPADAEFKGVCGSVNSGGNGGFLSSLGLIYKK